MRFRAQLKRQLDFLARSCKSFDEGFTDEAVRMATAVRVILHDTRSSTSLLTHLDAWHFKLVSTTREISAGAILVSSMGIHEIGPGGGRLRPNLGDDEAFLRRAAEWWNQVVFVLGPGRRVRRRDLVLVAANKDGGAHVDPRLTPDYERLAQDGAVVSYEIEIEGTKVEQPAKEAHFVVLRTMGWELLNSQAIAELVEMPA